MRSANECGMVVWESTDRPAIAARIAVCGDFLPAGRIAVDAASDWSEGAAAILPHFEDVTASFVNLECVLGAEGLAARTLHGIGDIVSAPAAALDYLAAIQARAVGIANNHSYDFGPAGAAITRAEIERRAMTPLGAGRKLADAPEICVWRGPADIRIGFWAAARATHDLATREAPGVEPATIERGEQALAAMNLRGARFRIALLHAGCLRTNRPDPDDVRLMDALAEKGFDVIAASHSHRISGWRKIAGRGPSPSYCFYGLGSLASGYVSSAAEAEGLVIVASLTPQGSLAQLQARAVALDAGGFGAAARDAQADTILGRAQALSAEVSDGSYARLFYHDMAQGMMALQLRDARTAFRQAGIRGLVRKAGRVRMRHVRRLVHKVMG
jgi:hypothetical protein